MHVHNTVNVYVNLLLHLYGIKVIIKCYNFYQIQPEKGATGLQYLLVSLRLHKAHTLTVFEHYFLSIYFYSNCNNNNYHNVVI